MALSDGTKIEFIWTRQNGSETHIQAEYQSNEDCWYITSAVDCATGAQVVLDIHERRELDYVAGDEYRGRAEEDC